MRVDAGLAQAVVQQSAAAGAGLAIHEADVLAGEVLDLANALGISGSDDQSLFPARKRYHVEVAIREYAADERQIEFSGSGILQMQTGDVYLAFGEPAERQLTGGGRADDLDAADFFHHAGKKTGGRVATRQHQPFP